MTKYLVRCKNKKCGHIFGVDEQPPSYEKPRMKSEDIAPSGILKTTTGQKSICPKCGEIGASPV